MRPVASRRSRKWLLPMSRCAVIRPAARSVSPSLNFSRTSAMDPLTSNPEPNGSTPFARRASIFLRRRAINSFSFSIEAEFKAQRENEQLEYARRAKAQKDRLPAPNRFRARYWFAADIGLPMKDEQ